MKTLAKNTLATTGITLVVLATIATAYGGSVIFISSIFQSLFVNILINFGLVAVNKIESKYYFLEILYKVIYVLMVLIPSGYIFGWYSTTPLWIVILMGVGIYAVGCLMSIFKVSNDVAAINSRIQVLKSQNN